MTIEDFQTGCSVCLLVTDISEELSAAIFSLQAVNFPSHAFQDEWSIWILKVEATVSTDMSVTVYSSTVISISERCNCQRYEILIYDWLSLLKVALQTWRAVLHTVICRANSAALQQSSTLDLKHLTRLQHKHCHLGKYVKTVR
jgi:hypothetical protein